MTTTFLIPLTVFILLFSKSVQLDEIVGRIDVEIYDSLNNWSFREFSLACPFFVILSGWFVFYVAFTMSCCYFTIVNIFVSECFSNGTITVVLPKLELVPHILPDELSLRDPSCKPSYSQDYFAYFHFGVTTCGTTRKVQGCSDHIFTQLLCNKVIH